MVLDRFRLVRLAENADKKSNNNEGQKPAPLQAPARVLQNSPDKARRNQIQILSNEDLILSCVQSNTSIYWQEFYRRFNRLIDSRILKTLYGKGIPIESIDQPMADEISYLLLLKIHTPNWQQKALVHENIAALLMETVRNVVLDWFKQKQGRYQAVQKEIERTSTSLDETIGNGEDGILLVNMTADPNTNPLFEDEREKMRERVAELLVTADALPIQQRLAFKVFLMFYNPLSDEEIEEVAKLRSVTSSKIKEETSIMLDQLVEKNEQYEHRLNLLADKFFQLQKLQRKLYEMEKDIDTPEGILNETIKDIQATTKKVVNLRKLVKKINVHPTAAATAQLLGIPESKQKDLNVWLHRTRKLLKQM